MTSTSAHNKRYYFGELQLRVAAAVIGVSMLSVPYVILPGAIYALIIVLYFPLCWFTFGRLPSCILMLLHLYQIMVCLIDSRDLWEFMDLNSQLMLQSAVALLTLSFIAFRRRWLLLFVSIIILCGVGAAALEWRGIDVISYLPSRSAVSMTSIGGPVTYGFSDIRYRGFYAESSALGAVLGGLALVLLFGAISEWKRGSKVYAGIAAVSAGVGMLGMAFVLTKAGIAVLVAAYIALLFGLPFAFGRRGVVLAGGVAVATLTIGSVLYTALPVESKDYLISEIDSVKSFASGAEVSNVKGKGVFGRTEGFVIAINSLVMKPFGGAPSGILDIVEDRQVAITAELMFYFNNGIYGLKSALANIAARGGLVGLLLLGILLFYSFDLVCTMRMHGVILLQALVFIAMALAFYVVIEDRYFYLAFTFLLAGFHRHLIADAQRDKKPNNRALRDPVKAIS